MQIQSAWALLTLHLCIESYLGLLRKSSCSDVGLFPVSLLTLAFVVLHTYLLVCNTILSTLRVRDYYLITSF
jgi:hypothetical protein